MGFYRNTFLSIKSGDPPVNTIQLIQHLIQFGYFLSFLFIRCFCGFFQFVALRGPYFGEFFPNSRFFRFDLRLGFRGCFRIGFRFGFRLRFRLRGGVRFRLCLCIRFGFRFSFGVNLGFRLGL